MKLVKVAPALALSALLLSGCNQGESVKLDNHIDQASYGVGLNIGRQIAQDDVKVNADAIAAGIRDAINNEEPRLTEDVIAAAFDQLREEQMRKQSALDDEASKASEIGRASCRERV